MNPKFSILYQQDQMSLLLHLLGFDVFTKICKVDHYKEHVSMTIWVKMVLLSTVLFTINIQNEFYIDILFMLAFVQRKLSKAQRF